MSSREIIYAAAGASGPATYIEDVFSTYLYTGNGTFSGETQAIPNGIDLATNGGMVWIKNRTSAGTDNCVSDTVRGGTSNMIRTNSTAAATGAGSNISFQTTGFTCLTSGTNTNYTGENYCSWTFRKQPKFFDIQTFTATGSLQTISHSLGSTPGMMILKRTDGTASWIVYHRGLTYPNANPINNGITLNSTSAGYDYTGIWGTGPTSTNFQFDTTGLTGWNFVVYLFAHDAGGFGLTGTDNVISCGSYTGNGSNAGPTITLGYEPQYVLIKSATSAQGWWIFDSMRGGLSLVGYTALTANTSNAEVASSSVQLVGANATGFQLTNSTPVTNASGQTYIYMAIRRGPMATPTVATTVFNPVYGQSGAPGFRSSNFNAGVDTSFVFLTSGYNDGTNAYQNIQTRLTGLGQLQTGNTRAEISQSYNTWDYMNGQNNTTFYSAPWGSWLFRRAPGFHDVVCYTGTGASRTLTHNLTVAPELIIIKSRSGAYSWSVGSLFTSSNFVYNTLETTDAGQTFTYAAGVVFNGQPSASSVFLNSSGGTNGSGDTFVMYLFATISGVSKVGSYTGTGSTQTINAGLPTGARFVLIKRTDSTGNWWVWDTTRGMVAGTNPRLALNNYNAEINNNWVYTVTNGFQIVTTDATVNASGGSYIYLAIA